jgi:hypothetical protein
VRSLERDELRRALASSVAVLLRESTEAQDMVSRVEELLLEIASGSLD